MNKIFNKKLKKEVKISIGILIMLIVVFFTYNNMNRNDVTYIVETKQIEKTEVKTRLDELQSGVNKDIIGYFTFDNNGDIRELPLVYTDSEFYMNHDLQGKKDGAGSIFVNSNESPVTTSNNLLVYGHSSIRKDVNFTFLKQMSNKKYFDNNKYFTYTDEYGEHKYEIMFVVDFDMNSNEEIYIDWFTNYYHNKEEAKKILDNTSKYAINKREYEYDGERLMTLITCNMEKEDSRYVVFSKEVKEG